jgi:hypothetical protein
MRILLTRVMLLVVCICACGVVLAQTDTAAPNKDKPAKPKRVWTNEEVENIRGGVNVVGDSKPSPESAKKPRAETNEFEAKEAAEDESGSCLSDAWGAGVAGVMRAQGATMSRNFWATKLFGGACLTGVKLEAVSTGITGDYALDDGTKLAAKAEVVKGLPTAATMVASVNKNQPFLVSWKNWVWIVTDVQYIDREYWSNGGSTHIYTIAKATMTDPLGEKVMIFDATKTPVSEIEGSVVVSVSARQ